MDLDQGPLRTLLVTDRAGPSRVPGAQPLPVAVLALPPEERAGLDQMTAIVGRQLDQIRASGVVPDGFAGTMHAHDQVLASLGLTVPASQTDARAVVASHDAHLAETHSAETRPAELSAATPPLPDGHRDAVEPARPPDPEAVRRAALVFQNALSRDVRNLDVVVTRDDLDRITETVRSLSPEDTRAVYDTLSREDRERWAAELTADYSPDERSELYGLLAERFDGPYLLNFAYYNQHDGSTGVDGRLFGEAVAAHAPEAVAEAFVRNASTYTVLPEARGAIAAESSAFEARAEIGAAAAGALSGLRGAAFDRAFDALEQSGRLGAVVGRSVHAETVPSAGTSPPALRYDADTLGNLLRAASASQSSLAKGRLVDEASRMLGRMEGADGAGAAVAYGDSIRQVRGGITEMLREDPVGVVQALEQGPTKYDGSGLASYLDSMLESGQAGEVGNLLVRLGTGNGTARSSAEWVTVHGAGDVDAAVTYPNARALGYAVGSLRMAIAARADETHEQGKVVKDIFGAAAGVAGAVNFGAGAVATVLTGAADLAVDALVNARVSQGKSLEGTLFELAFPRNPDGSPYNGPAQNDFDGAANATAIGTPP